MLERVGDKRKSCPNFPVGNLARTSKYSVLFMGRQWIEENVQERTSS